LKFDIAVAAVLQTREASNADTSKLLITVVEDDEILHTSIKEHDARIAGLDAQLFK
jgi:hypothetical protein